jgi:magnesium-protoporphyrin O-methyltransferase
MARRYRKRGLDRPSRRMVDWLKGQGLDGASVLEIGGGVGEIQLELLRQGAARTTNLELSPAYDPEAAALAAEAGMSDRVTRRLGDIAVDAGIADVHDFVVMHRVVCCYPDAEGLLGAAARHARRGVILTHPPRNIVTRALRVLEDFWLGLLGREYRTFAHPPEVMEGILRANGFEPVRVHHGLPWRVLAATPSGSA